LNRARQQRYEKSEKGRAATAARQRKYMKSRLTVKVAGSRFTYQIPDGLSKDDLRVRLAEFRTAQRTDYKEATNGGFDPAVS
jgi:hypothetical protein